MTAVGAVEPSADAAADGEGPPWRLRMRDLCARSGLPRQAIHFYIQQGVLPPGRKTGRNTALYGEQHVERLALIRRLQHERFLPLRAIRALLDGRDAAAFSEPQRAFLREVRAHLPEGALAAARGTDGTAVAAAALAARLGADVDDVERLAEVGLLGGARDASGNLRVAAGDAWMIELVAALRAAGFTRTLGFEVEDLTVYDEAVDRILRFETGLLSKRLADLPAEEAARMVARALPLMEAFLVKTHAARLRDFLDSL